MTSGHRIHLGASTLGFRHDPLDVALDEIAAQGFHLIDIAMYPSYCPHFHALAASADDKRALGDDAANLGLELTLELHKSMLMARQRGAPDLMALVDHPAVGVALDPSHVTYAGENVATIARALDSLVKHVHLRDARGQDIMVVPGDGEVDFAALAAALGEIGYDRAAVIELQYAAARAPDVRPDLARAKALLSEHFVAV